MAKIYKITAYIVDPNGCFDNGEDWFKDVMNYDRNVFCPTPIEHQAVEFEWDDNLPINYIGCKKEDCEEYFKEG